MAISLKLPVGIDDFSKIRRNNFYYVDKTKLIEQLLGSWGEVNLFTRPRRFGKTLNMSMFRYFFEIGTDEALFSDLYILKNRELCEEYMGKFPVVFLSLKGVEGLTFEAARYRLTEIIGREAKRFQFLLDSNNLTDDDKNRYRAIINLHDGQYMMNQKLLESALYILSELLFLHYGKKVIILIDEYDVPLDKAYKYGYYEEMLCLIRALLGDALKTNSFLQFAVLTGCLRVSKESIFTGLNNFKVLSITDCRFDEQFGFTEQKAKPQSYWLNTSGNELVKIFIDKANKTTRNEIEALVLGESIEKFVRQELTYDEIDKTIDNLWSVLFTTGYLTQTGITEQGAYKLIIPNKEVREVYKMQIQEWFKNKVFNNTEQLTDFWKSIENGDTEEIEKYLNRTLSNSISVFDTKAHSEEKENVYHTLLVGLLAGNEDWLVKSNVEAGEGFADIIVETDNVNAGIVIELKYSKKAVELDKSCERAIKQIKDRRYYEYLKNDGRNDILLYGIAFCKKRCKVVVEKLNE